jgi:hypothetical protein
MKTTAILLSAATFWIAWGSSAHASLIDNSTVSITDLATPFSGTYAGSNAIDTDGDFELTDYASNRLAANTFIDFDFGQTLTFTKVEYTDRVTSTGPQGSFTGGLSDFVSGFDLIFSTDATFGNIDDVVVSTTNIQTPTNPSTPADFTTSVSINSINARYLRWDVTAAPNLSAAGASNFNFYAIPEPASVVLIGLFTTGIWIRRRFFID